MNDERFGSGVTTLTLEERLAAWQSSDAELHVRRLAFQGDAIVGAASILLPLLESTEIADHGVAVEASIPVVARSAVIEALTDDAERIAAEHGRTTLMGGSPAAASGAITATTGFGAVDPDEPEAAAMLARGYALDLAAPSLDERWADASARAAEASHDTVAWSGETPAEHRP